jgi:VWFA-related protein
MGTPVQESAQHPSGFVARLRRIPATDKDLPHGTLEIGIGRIACALLVITSAALGQEFQAHHEREKQSQFSVQVDLISLDVEVLNQNGEPVRDLTRNDFAIREDGKPRELSSFAWVTGQPVSLTVILDTSAVTTEKLSVAKEYITLLVHLLAPEDEICLYTYDYRDAWLEQNFTRERLALVQALENIGVTSGKKRTFLRELFGPEPRAGLSVDVALLNASKGSNERKALLVVSDRHKGLGEATDDHVSKSGCAIYVLSLSDSAEALAELETDPSNKGRLARESGGRQFVAERQDMKDVCRSIAYALKNHYTITYLTEIGVQPQAPRRIEVLLPGQNCIIHARQSYTIQAPR